MPEGAPPEKVGKSGGDARLFSAPTGCLDGRLDNLGRDMAGRTARRVPMVLAVTVLAGTAIAGCRSTTTSSARLPGALPVTVTSVRATLTPYNPVTSSGGVPAEEVRFVVVGTPSGPFVCDIVILYSGQTVGSTSISASPPAGHPPTVSESVPVAISRATFTGAPSDARVTCRASATPGAPGTTTTSTPRSSTTATTPGTVPMPTSAGGQAPPQASPAQTQIEHDPLGPVCLIALRPGSSPNAPQNPASLPNAPVAVDAVRIPGLNDPVCQSGVVTTSGAMAARVAADVNAAQQVPPGATYHCPADDDHGIDLVFRYARPSEAIAVSVGLAGCRFLTGLATNRWTGPAVTSDLKQFVPAAWF